MTPEERAAALVAKFELQHEHGVYEADGDPYFVPWRDIEAAIAQAIQQAEVAAYDRAVQSLNGDGQ